MNKDVMKRMISLVLAAILSFLTGMYGIDLFNKPNRYAYAGTNDTARYTVLVLDTSGSMRGEAMEAQIKAAEKFCEDIMQAQGENYIAVVELNTTAKKVCEFTNNKDTVFHYINTITVGGGTNINAALEMAGQLLLDVKVTGTAKLIKNIILCTDGIPESGKTSENGHYTEQDGEYYEYGNCVYDTAEQLKADNNIYSLGFFHDLSGEDLAFAQKLLKDTASSEKQYYEVTDPEKLVFVFGEMANNIIADDTQDGLKQRYIDEHIKYYKTLFSQQIQPITRGDIMAARYGGPTASDTYNLHILYEDMNTDLSDKLYEKMSVFFASLDTLEDFFKPSSYIDVEWNNLEISYKMPDSALMDLGQNEYSVILYQLLASDASYQGLINNYSVDYAKNLKDLVENISDQAEQLIKNDVSESHDAIIEKMFEASNVIKTASPESTKFLNAYEDFEKYGNQYLDVQKTKKYLEDSSKFASDSFVFFGSVLDECKTIAQAYQYACYAETYAETNGTFKAILESIAASADWEQERLKEIPFRSMSEGDYSYPYSKISMYRNLSKSIKSFIKTMDACAKDANAEFKRQIIDGMGDTCVDLVSDFCMGMLKDIIGAFICPELEAVNIILRSGKLLTDLFTTIDDEQKTAFSVKILTMIVDLVQPISSNTGDRISRNKVFVSSGSGISFLVEGHMTLDQCFEETVKFDESIKFYKNAMLYLCDYGCKYEKLKLNSWITQLSNNMLEGWYKLGATSDNQRKISLYSNIITVLSTQKLFIGDIHCHDDQLVYDKSSGIIQYNGKCKVITIACPVAVSVTDSQGRQIAYLSGDARKVDSAYEPYFANIPLDKTNKEYMKILMIPDDNSYHVTMKGLDEGKMSVYISSCENGQINDVEVYSNVPIKKDETGYISAGDKDNALGYLVINNQKYAKAVDNENTATGHSRSSGVTVNGDLSSTGGGSAPIDNGKTLTEGSGSGTGEKDQNKQTSDNKNVSGTDSGTGGNKDNNPAIAAGNKTTLTVNNGTCKMVFHILSASGLEGEVALSSVSGNSQVVKIPTCIKNQKTGILYQVSAIKKKAFKQCSSVQSVVIGSQVKVIEARAFKGCKLLKSITNYNTRLSKIGKRAFSDIKKKATIKIEAQSKSKYQKVKKLFQKAGAKKAKYMFRVKSS